MPYHHTLQVRQCLHQLVIYSYIHDLSLTRHPFLSLITKKHVLISPLLKIILCQPFFIEGSFTCDFVFYLWFRLLLVISSFTCDFVFFLWFRLLLVISSFTCDFVFYLWFRLLLVISSFTCDLSFSCDFLVIIRF